MSESCDADRRSGMVEDDDRAPLRDTYLVKPRKVALKRLEAAVPTLRISSDRLEAITQVGTQVGGQLLQPLNGIAFEHQRIHGRSMRNVQGMSMHKMHT